MLTARPQDSDARQVNMATPQPARPSRDLQMLAMRRRVLGGLVGFFLSTGLLGLLPSLRNLWWAAGTSAVVIVAYVATLIHARNLAAEQEWATAWSANDSLEWLPSEDVLSSAHDEPVTLAPVLDRWELLPFMLACLTGWLLTPLVVLSRWLARGHSPFATAWADRLAGLQVRLRQRSLRALTVSVAATVGVTGLGSLASMAFASPASAAPAPAVATAAPSTATAAAGSSTYVVRQGDTLSAIARRYGTTAGSIASTNHLANPNLIYPGQTLIVTGGPAVPEPTPPAASRYVVQAGDTLGAVARRYGTTVAALASINHLSNPNLIYPGQVLLLTGSSAPTPTPAPAPIVAPRPAPAPAPLPPVAAVPNGTAAAVQAAMAQIGKPYVWGGAGPNAFDCSGLVRFAWSVAGISLPHNAAAQYQSTSRISGGALQPGDLVFYGSPEPYHVSMYVGNGQVIAADNSGTNVRVESISWVGQPMGYGRVN